MSDLTVTGYVTRTELSLSNLTINDDTYKIIRDMWGPGVVQYDRQKVSSPYVNGDFLTNRKKAQVEMPLGIRVTGTSKIDCWNKVGTLLRAFEQFSYELSLTIDGTTFTYTCEAADYSVGDGGMFQTFHMKAYKQEVRLLIPRRPTPTEGPT
jgi:hypothetical protein